MKLRSSQRSRCYGLWIISFTQNYLHIKTNILCLLAFLVLCFFQDFCKRRSVWKHISHSNDTEALAVDAFKKQCYMKVNRAIKWFLKRQCGTREVPALLWAWTWYAPYGSGAQVGFAENNGLYIFLRRALKDKIGRVRKRGVTRQNSRGGPLSRHKSC